MRRKIPGGGIGAGSTPLVLPLKQAGPHFSKAAGKGPQGCYGLPGAGCRGTGLGPARQGDCRLRPGVGARSEFGPRLSTSRPGLDRQGADGESDCRSRRGPATGTRSGPTPTACAATCGESRRITRRRLPIIPACCASVRTTANAYYYRGMCRYCKKEYEKAIADFNEVLCRQPETISCLSLERAFARQRLRVYDKAEEDFTESHPSAGPASREPGDGMAGPRFLAGRSSGGRSMFHAVPCVLHHTAPDDYVELAICRDPYATTSRPLPITTKPCGSILTLRRAPLPSWPILGA